MEFTEGRRYRVTFLPSGARTRTRTVEMNYLGTHAYDSGEGKPGHDLVFDGRPEFGTATLWPDQIREAIDIGPARWS